MTRVLCPRSTCVYQHREGYCTREEIELEYDYDPSEYRFIECKQYIED